MHHTLHKASNGHVPIASAAGASGGKSTENHTTSMKSRCIDQYVDEEGNTALHILCQLCRDIGYGCITPADRRRINWNERDFSGGFSSESAVATMVQTQRREKNLDILFDVTPEERENRKKKSELLSQCRQLQSEYFSRLSFRTFYHF
jgi:hypothetical protein